jgi:uncharacterized protein VirK/YbjX
MSAALAENRFKNIRFKGRQLSTQLIDLFASQEQIAQDLEQKQNETLEREIIALSDKDRSVLLGLLANLAKEGEVFSDFIQSRKELLNALLNRHSQED